MPDLAAIRDECGEWDDNFCSCEDNYPDECPFHVECREDAEKEDQDESSGE